MGVMRYMADKLVNVVAGLGTARDKAAGSGYFYSALNDAQLSAMYRSAWLPRKIVDIPAFDSVRRWRNWQAEAGQIGRLDAEESRLGVREKLLDALIKARLYGGAAILIGTGEPDASEELQPDAIKAGGVQYLTVLMRKHLTAGERETDPLSPLYGRPRFYTATSQTKQITIHPSRLAIFEGAGVADEDDATTNQGWSDSVLQSVGDAITNSDSTLANVASLVFEAKVDVFKVPDLMVRLGEPGFQNDILERFRLAAMGKGINGALLMDAAEDYQQKSASFAGLPDIIDRMLQVVSGAADIPLTRLLGQSPGGLNSTGDADLRNYYDHIQSIQELKITPAMHMLDECLIRSALGSRPADIWYTWASLWQTTSRERADIGKVTAETIKTLSETSLYAPDALSKASVNMLTELGVMPGLEAAIEEFGERDFEEDDREAEQKAKAGETRQPLADFDPNQLRDPDGKWTNMFHGSTGHGEELVVRPDGVFGGVFASGSEESANSHRDDDGDLYEIDIAEDSILTQQALSYELDAETTRGALRKAMPWAGDDDIDFAWEAVIEESANNPSHADDLTRVFREDDFGAASWEAQRIRGRVAKELGDAAVEMNDEHGTSYLILPGAKLRRVKSKTGDAAIADASPAAAMVFATRANGAGGKRLYTIRVVTKAQSKE